MRGRAGLAPVVVFAVTFVSRVVTAARFPTEWDSAQLAIGLRHFDVRQDSPNAPGYWAYVALGRVVRALTPLGAHASLVVVTAVASALTGGLFYLIGRRVAGSWFGGVLAALWLTNPFAWFYGSIVNVKVFDSLAITALLLLALAPDRDGRRLVLGVAVTALLAGFRPTSVIVVGPLLMVVIVRNVRGWRDLAWAAAAGIAALAVWMVPLAMEQPGGLATVRAANNYMFTSTSSLTSWFGGAPRAAARDNTMFALVGAAVAVAPAAVVALVGLVALGWRRARASVSLPYGRALVATVPGLLLVALVHFGTPGFTLSHLAGSLVLMVLPIAVATGRARGVAVAVTAVVCVASAGVFLASDRLVPSRVSTSRFLPNGVTWHAIRATDRDTRRWEHVLRPFHTDRDVLVFAPGAGIDAFRALSYLAPRFASHLVLGPEDGMATYRNQLWFEGDRRIEVPPGGDAVLLLDPSGPRVIPPGGTVAGVAVVASGDAFHPKLDAYHLRPCTALCGRDRTADGRLGSNRRARLQGVGGDREGAARG